MAAKRPTVASLRSERDALAQQLQRIRDQRDSLLNEREEQRHAQERDELPAKLTALAERAKATARYFTDAAAATDEDERLTRAFQGVVALRWIDGQVKTLLIGDEDEPAKPSAGSHVSTLTIDADWSPENSWEIVLRFDAEDQEGAWTGLSDEELLSDTFTQLIGRAIAEAVTRERNAGRSN